MKKTNFDTSTTGTNIELTVAYDTDLAQMYFDDFLEEVTKIKLDSNSYLYVMGDTSLPMYKKSKLNKLSKDELFELANDYDLFSYTDNIENCKKSEIVTMLVEFVTIEKHYTWLADRYTWNNITAHFEHDYYITRGYSQGDAQIIIQLDGEISDETKKYIDNTFWDSPVYLSIEIDDVEVREFEILDNPYDYDKDFVINWFKNNWLYDNNQEVIEFLENNLPEYPENW